MGQKSSSWVQGPPVFEAQKLKQYIKITVQFF